MKYLYINKRNELFISDYTTTSNIGENITIVVNKYTFIRGTIVDKYNGVKLIDWDILNSVELFKDLDLETLETEALEFANL
jgi:hypothetical protein